MTCCWTHLFAVLLLCSSLAPAMAKGDGEGGFIVIEYMKDHLRISCDKAFHFFI